MFFLGILVGIAIGYTVRDRLGDVGSFFKKLVVDDEDRSKS
jgi:hypothetical protein